jgi:uncharacterized damage-inducible protein DinB
MNLADSVRFSITHSFWAITRLLADARRLTEAQLNQDLGIGPGSFRVNIAHTLEAAFFFADCFAGRDCAERPGFGPESGTIDGLARLAEQARRDLSDAMLGAIGRGLPARLVWASSDSGYASAAAAIAQVFDHSTLHRTQCIHILKRLGVSPLPDLDPLSFEAAGLPRDGSEPMIPG